MHFKIYFRLREIFCTTYHIRLSPDMCAAAGQLGGR